jgi:pentapeptide MXKDX repeat protein
MKNWIIALTLLLVAVVFTVGVVGCSSPTSHGDKMGADKMGADKMGTDKMGTDKMGTDKMGTDKMGTDRKDK